MRSRATCSVTLRFKDVFGQHDVLEGNSGNENIPEFVWHLIGIGRTDKSGHRQTLVVKLSADLHVRWHARCRFRGLYFIRARVAAKAGSPR